MNRVSASMWDSNQVFVPSTNTVLVHRTCIDGTWIPSSKNSIRLYYHFSAMIVTVRRIVWSLKTLYREAFPFCIYYRKYFDQRSAHDRIKSDSESEFGTYRNTGTESRRSSAGDVLLALRAAIDRGCTACGGRHGASYKVCDTLVSLFLNIAHFFRDRIPFRHEYTHVCAFFASCPLSPSLSLSLSLSLSPRTYSWEMYSGNVYQLAKRVH